MTIGITIRVIMLLVAVFSVCTLSVECKMTVTERRLQILERKFATNVYEMSLLQQRTDSVEARLELLEDTPVPTRQHEPVNKNEAKERDIDNKNEALYKAFQAEKVQRLRLEDMCEDLQRNLKEVQESSQLERQTMDKKINLLIGFQQTVNQSVIPKQVEENRKDIGGVREEVNTKLKTLTNELSQKVNKKQGDLRDGIGEIRELVKSNTDSLNEKLEQYKSDAVSLVDITNLLDKRKISFSARLGSKIADLEPYSTLVFNHVITNHGQTYSGSTGIFTAPMDGAYVFYVHILNSSKVLEMYLKKNNTGMMWLYAHGSSHGADGNMVVLQLAKGDKITVVKYGAWGGRPFYVHPTWTTFSGFMLYAN